MIPAIHKIWRPAVFQGNLKKTNYFEGWYFKIADPSAQQVYAIIPGISLNDKNHSHAFIQVLNGKTAQSWYFTFPTDQFKYQSKKLDVQIGDNHFSEQGLDLNINVPELIIKGEITFGQFNPWPVKRTSPGVMGWYAFVPFMECYHGVVSFDHDLRGKLEINGKEISFDEGKGYIEKDWGTSFPKYYIWIQSNHFEKAGISLMASVANIPWLGNSFDGFIIGLFYQNKVHRFTTYTGARIDKLNYTDNTAEIIVSDKKYRLEIMAKSDSEGGVLQAPKSGAMTDRIRESMNSEVEIKLIDSINKKVIYSGKGRNAGFEMGGDLSLLKEINQPKV
jgi:hypothetical protein